MSDFTYSPDYAKAVVTRQPRVRNASFGDGYQQRVADGINTDFEVWDLTFIRRTSDAAALDAQLRGYGGVTSFTWTPYGHDEIRVVCQQWSREKTDFGVDTINARFEQVAPAAPAYQAPAFTAFAITGVSSPMEVGASFGPAVTFTWSTSNSGNVATNSIEIDDAGTPVETGTANDGTHAETLGGAVTLTTAGTHVFNITGTDTEATEFTRALTLTWLWRRYYGANASPTLTEAAIEALASSGLATGYAGTYSMPAGGYKYICFAHAAGGQINSVKDANTGFDVPMAAGTFTDGGGFGFEKVSVTNAQGVTTDVRVYRTFNSLGGAITLTVT